MKQHLKEIERILKRTQAKDDPDYAAFRSKTTNLKVMGHRLPVMQQIVKDGFSFYEKPEKEIHEIWNHIWKNTTIHEAMSLPLFYYRNHRPRLGKKEWNILKTWINEIENWEHSDALSYLYSFLFEKDPKMVLPTLKKWNRSKNPWKQRASIVPLIYYASPNRKAPPAKLVLSMVEPLIGSADKYVNKAVGWTLRECYNLYPKPTLAFLKKHIGRLSANGFSYSTEKLNKKTKAELKKIRATKRRQK